MPIVQAQCTNCGGILEIEKDKESAICPFCKTPYIVEKAINNYNINIYNKGLSADEIYENAKNFLSVHKDYARAREQFEDLVEKCPNDYRGWWGVVCAVTENFTVMGISPKNMHGIENYAHSSFKVCKDESTSLLIKTKWDSYKTAYDKAWSIYEAANTHLSTLLLKKDALKRKIPEYEKETKGKLFLRLVGFYFSFMGIVSLLWYVTIGRTGEEDIKDIMELVLVSVLTVLGVIILIIEKRKRRLGKNKLQSAQTELQKIEQELKEINLDALKPV